MNNNDQFAITLSYLQCVLLARRRQINLDGLKLKWIDFDILNILLIHGTLQPSSLSQFLSVGRPAISKRLAYLQKHQLIIQTKHHTDKRMHIITLASRGKSIMSAIFESHDDITVEARRILSKEEQSQFELLARKLASHLDDLSLRMI